MDKPASRDAAAAQFKLGMRCLAGAVSIITTHHGGRPYGMTATAVCSATAEPPAVLACINRSATTHQAIAEAGIFCVNVLRLEDRELSGIFSGTQTGAQRFRPERWMRLATGAPALIDSLAAFDCRVANRMVHGTHTVYLGAVAQVRIGRKGKPLLYADGQYAKLASLAHGVPLPEGLDYWGE